MRPTSRFLASTTETGARRRTLREVRHRHYRAALRRRLRRSRSPPMRPRSYELSSTATHIDYYERDADDDTAAHHARGRRALAAAAQPGAVGGAVGGRSIPTTTPRTTRRPRSAGRDRRRRDLRAERGAAAALRRRLRHLRARATRAARGGRSAARTVDDDTGSVLRGGLRYTFEDGHGQRRRLNLTNAAPETRLSGAARELSAAPRRADRAQSSSATAAATPATRCG